ncbi:MAG: ferritin-like domain-containing protein [Ruminococcaceae bacterium]|nr:ferritin-like domain-containing protein [Oscillospiraceae bacterium]
MMDETAVPALPTEADYRRYDRVWRRVSPELDPYPDVRAAAMEPRPPRPPAVPQPPAMPPDGRCMSGADEEAPETLRAFLRDELADAQTYRALARQAPTPEGRRLMQRLASDETGHVRALQTAYFLLTGGTYPVTVVLPPQPKLPWRDRLRERYHEETRGGAAYARAAEQTRDVCLRRLFERLSADEYRHAEKLEKLLEKTL